MGSPGGGPRGAAGDRKEEEFAPKDWAGKQEHPIFFVENGVGINDILFRRLKPMLLPALEVAGTHDFEDVVGGFESGAYQIWVAGEYRDPSLVVVTQINAYPRAKELTVCWVGGRALEGGRLNPVARAMMTRLEEFAARWRCDRMSGGGRPGWSRVMAPLGWSTGAVYRRDLSGGAP